MKIEVGNFYWACKRCDDLVSVTEVAHETRIIKVWTTYDSCDVDLNCGEESDNEYIETNTHDRDELRCDKCGGHNVYKVEVISEEPLYKSICGHNEILKIQERTDEGDPASIKFLCRHCIGIFNEDEVEAINEILISTSVVPGV
jgi:hypothetical protein